MLLKILDRLEEIIIASLMGAATLLTFVTVVHRFLVDVPVLYPYLFGINLAWSQELCIYMFIWMAKFGAAYGVRMGIHVGVRRADQPASIPGGARVSPLPSACWAARCSPPLSAPWVRNSSYELMQHRPDLARSSRSRAGSFTLCIPLGSYLMCFRFLQVCVRLTGAADELPHHDAHPCRRHRGRSSKTAPDRAGRSLMSAALIFGLLFALMLTGMPVSISLGLTRC